MGLATLAVTEVSHVTVEAEEGVPEASKPAAAESQRLDLPRVRLLWLEGRRRTGRST